MNPDISFFFLFQASPCLSNIAGPPQLAQMRHQPLQFCYPSKLHRRASMFSPHTPQLSKLFWARSPKMAESTSDTSRPAHPLCGARAVVSAHCSSAPLGRTDCSSTWRVLEQHGRSTLLEAEGFFPVWPLHFGSLQATRSCIAIRAQTSLRHQPTSRFSSVMNLIRLFTFPPGLVGGPPKFEQSYRIFLLAPSTLRAISSMSFQSLKVSTKSPQVQRGSRNTPDSLSSGFDPTVQGSLITPPAFLRPQSPRFPDPPIFPCARIMATCLS